MLDFTMHLYTLALFFVAIPLAVGPAPNPPIVPLFFMTMSFFTAPVGVVLLVSLMKPTIPWPLWCSSDKYGEKMKPAAFYVCEDLLAVDFRHGRPMREALHARYNASPPYQSLMRRLTLLWAFGCFLYVAIDAIITFLASQAIAFALVLAMFFVFLALWIIFSIGLFHFELKREHAWWEERRREAREEGRLQHPGGTTSV
jgi:hypothetical protein